VSICLIPEQFGFRFKKSTTTSLVSFVNYLTDSIEKAKQVDAIDRPDARKAFDTVNHSALELLGLSIPLLSWITEYLRGRHQLCI